MTKQDKEAERTSWVVKEIKEYAIHDPYDNQHYMSVISRILKRIGKKKLKILDLGCGSSSYGIRFAKLGHEVIGVDISKEAVGSARKRAKLAQVPAIFEVGDIEKLNFPTSSFDVCFFGGVLHHFPDLKLVIQEAKRVLKNKGYLVFVEPNKQNPHVFLSMEPKSPFRYKHLTINERSIHYAEILTLLKGRIINYDIFYKLMTLTKTGRHASKSFFDADFIYKHGGFVWKYVRGGVINKLMAIFAYNVAHVYQKFASNKRAGNFVILTAQLKK